MALETILQTLEAEAERLVTEIDQATQAEVERIRAEAQVEAAAVRQKHITAITVPLRTEQARIINRAKLEALQLVLGTREDLINEVLDRVADRLEALLDTDTYAGLLRQLTLEAVEAMGADNLSFRVHSDDLALMNQLVQELKLAAVVTGGLEDDMLLTGQLGGVVASTADGRISLVNTPAIRLERAAQLHRAEIARLMFEAEQEG
jgi:vacuolar-type H+-ATPase subunit E/Vma4